jgi:hypothetical protein
MTVHRLRLTNDGPNTFVALDGQSISHLLLGAKITFQPGQLPVAELDVFTHLGEVDGQVHVRVPHETRELLVKLGWTPPPDLRTPEMGDAA